MPLLRNIFQPYFADPDSPAVVNCVDDGYCHLVQNGDEILTQFYQTPCEANLISDPDFGDYTLGGELITNGNFIGSLASWTVTPALSWVYSGGVNGSAQYEIASGVVNALSQTLAITAGNRYQVEFEVTGIAPGNYLEIRLGTNAVDADVIVNASGTYSFFINAGSANSDLTFTAISVNQIFVDNVSVKDATLNNWDTNGAWNINNGSACHIPGSTGNLIETVSNYIVNGDYYELTVHISGMTVGFVQAFIANQGQTFTANGIYTIYKTPSAAGVVKFTPSSDFDGCVSLPDLRKLRNDYDFSAENDADEFDITGSVEYYERYVTLKFNPETYGIPYGCFKIKAIDQCDVQFDDVVTNGGFNSGTSSGATGWTENNGSAQYDFSGNNAKFLYSGGPPQSSFPILINAVNTNIVAGNYEVTFTIVSNSDTTNIGATVYMDTYFESPVTYYSAPGTYTFQILNYNPLGPVPIGGSQRVRVLANFEKAGVKTSGNIIIDNVQVRRIEPFDATYLSDCINYQDRFDNTQIIQGYSDQPAFGFEYDNTGFKIQQRVVCRSYQAKYPTQKNILDGGSGTAKVTYAELEKYWSLNIGLVNQTVHDAIAACLSSDHLMIGPNTGNLREYISQAEDYVPQYSANGTYDTATSVINLRIKQYGQKFNRHC